jgi:hypothetical protein
MMTCWTSVPRIAISMPIAARLTPRDAVSARLRLLRPSMKKTEATR